MLRATLDKPALRAISRFAARDDIRYYLNAILIEFGTDEMRLVATNGHMLGAMRARYADGDVRPDATLEAIVPLELVKAIRKPGRRDTAAVMVEIDGDHVTVIDGDKRQQAKLIDAKFPAWRSIMPESVSGKVEQFNPELVYAFLDALWDLGSDLPIVGIAHNGDDAALVSIGHGDFIGILMPIRADAPVTAAPAWVNAPVSAPLPVAKVA